MNLALLLEENRFIVSPQRVDAPLMLPPFEFGNHLPIKLQVFRRRLTDLVSVDPAMFNVKLLVGTPNIRPTLGFWMITTTQGDSLPIASRATKEEVANALSQAFGGVTVEGGQGSYIVTLVAPGEWATPEASFEGVTISEVQIFENSPGTAETPAQYRIEVLEAAPAGIYSDEWTPGDTTPESSIVQLQNRLWQLTISQDADAGFYTLTIDGVTTEFISPLAGAYQVEMVLAAAGKPAQVQPDGTGGFYIVFAQNVSAASVGGFLVSFPSLEGTLDLDSAGLRELLDGQQFAPVTLTVVLSSDGETTSFTTNTILQMPINAGTPPRYITEDDGDSRYVHFLPAFNAYSGGGAGDIHNLETVDMDTPCLVVFKHATEGGLFYQLRDGTDAENLPFIIRTSDYNAVTNAKVLESIS